MHAGFIRIAAGAVKGSPLKHGFLTGQGWTYDDMAEQTGGDSICGMCRREAQSLCFLQFHDPAGYANAQA